MEETQPKVMGEVSRMRDIRDQLADIRADHRARGSCSSAAKGGEINFVPSTRDLHTTPLCLRKETLPGGRDPNLKTIFASFSDQLGERTNREVQRIMRSDAYIKIFGRTRLDIPGWSTNTGGAMIATLGRWPLTRSS